MSRKVIHVKQSIISEEADRAIMSTNVDIAGEEKNIYVSVKKEYGKYLCNERGDAFIAGLLRYALMGGYDIQCDMPVTEDILYHIKEILWKQFKYIDKEFQPIDIICESAPALLNAGAVGTGMSCGVDSFHAVANHYNIEYESKKLTHLAIYNVGSINGVYKNAGLNYVKEKVFERAYKVAEELKLPVVELESNIQIEIPQNHLLTHTYTDLFAIYSLQKLWGTYYYASGYGFAEFDLSNGLKDDPAYWELLLLQMFSTNTLKVYSEGGSGDRLQKLYSVAEFETARKYLHVCTAKENNCSHCEKCMRTMLGLDAIGKLEAFESVFDVSGYRQNPKKYYKYCCKQHVLGNHFYEPIFKILYSKNRELFDSILKNYELKNVLKKLSETENLLNRWRGYSNLFRMQVSAENYKANLIKYLKKQNVKTVAFMGDGEIRRFLYEMLKETDIEVKYMIDDVRAERLPFPIYNRVEVEKGEYVDAFIVTDIFAGEITKRLLKDKCKKIFMAKELFPLQGGNKL